MIKYTEGVKTDPSTSLLLADTGALTGTAGLNVTLQVKASVAATVKLQRRDATNVTTIEEQSFDVLPYRMLQVTIQVPLFGESQRVRAILGTGITGTIRATIMASAQVDN